MLWQHVGGLAHLFLMRCSDAELLMWEEAPCRLPEKGCAEPSRAKADAVLGTLAARFIRLHQKKPGHG